MKEESKKPEEKKEETASSADKGEATIEDLKKQLEELKKQKDEYLAGWQRERADFLNYKKEEMERIGQLINYAKEELILEILPVMDNFDVIEKRLPEYLKKNENIKGLLQIKIQFQGFLKSLGVEEIKSVGEKFDPHYHEIVEEVEVKDKEQGTIIEEIQKGYKSNGGLLRPARVKVVK